MKYPIKQFEEFVLSLKKLSNYINIAAYNPSVLHFIIYQQYPEGQSHNWLYVKGKEIKKAHSIEDLTNWNKLIQSNFDFKLYPDGCNDTHVGTAGKKAVKIVLNK